MASRQNPSERFRELQRIYGEVHAGGLTGADDGAKLFAGNSLLPFVERIRDLAQSTGARTLLDYGASKGAIHKQTRIALPGGKTAGPVRDFWNVDSADRKACRHARDARDGNPQPGHSPCAHPSA